MSAVDVRELVGWDLDRSGHRDAAGWSREALRVRSHNPDLQLRLEAERGGGCPFAVDGGSPFFEVAEFGGRWFLRDGYHRAYALLRAGVYRMVAVVRARTMEELGATEPWFFGEEVLFFGTAADGDGFSPGGDVRSVQAAAAGEDAAGGGRGDAGGRVRRGEFRL